MGEVMNKGMQIEVIKKLLENQGVSADLKDIEQEIDSTLSLPENIKLIAKKYGLKLTKEQIQEWLNKISEEYEEFKNEELFEEYLKELLGEHHYMELLEEEEKKQEEFKRVKEEYDRRFEEEEEAHAKTTEQFLEELRQQGVLVDYMASMIAPNLQGDVWHSIRKAALLTLVTYFDKREGVRRRLHILIHGEPGTAKTEFIRWIYDYLGYYLYAQWADANLMSQVGLTGDARGKEITPGILHEAHGGILLIDELDKANPKDYNGLLQAMETGRYRIVKGKHRQWFNAEVKIIATANEIKKFPKQLMDRFDFIFELKTPSREERENAIDGLVDLFFSDDISDETACERLIDYFKWLGNFEPKISDDEKEKIKLILKVYIHDTKISLDELSYRNFELSILRIAYALAKAEKRNITAMDAVEALKMKDNTLGGTLLVTLKTIARASLEEAKRIANDILGK